MKHLIGVSAVLIAVMHSPSAALERAAPDALTRLLPKSVWLAQSAANVKLPAVRVAGVAGRPIAVNLKAPTSGVRFIKINDFPDDLQLSRGFRARGAWITSVQNLETLELITPPGLVKTFRLDVFYFRNSGACPARPADRA